MRSSTSLTVAPGTSLALRAGYDKTKVKRFVARIATRFKRKPESSQLLFRASKPVVTKAVLGRTIEQSKAVLAVEQQLAHGHQRPALSEDVERAGDPTRITVGPGLAHTGSVPIRI